MDIDFCSVKNSDHENLCTFCSDNALNTAQLAPNVKPWVNMFKQIFVNILNQLKRSKVCNYSIRGSVIPNGKDRK